MAEKSEAALIRWSDPDARWYSADWSRRMGSDTKYDGWMLADPLPE